MIDLEKKILAGQYYLKKRLGAGGMGQVYQVWDRKRCVYLAVKVIDNVRFFESFVREVGATVNLAHPNIIRFYNVGKDDGLGVIFIVMDWVDGHDVQRLFTKRGGPLGVGEVAHILDGVQSALYFAHLSNVIHCDVKPANILLKDADNQVLLGDFGLAHVAHDRSGGGTPYYMAPELFSGGQVSIRSDIYALGVTLYQLLSGRLPFSGKTREILISEHISKSPPSIQSLNPRLPNGLAKVIEKSLEKDPNRRQQSVTELWTDFSKCIYGERDAPSYVPNLYGIKGENTHIKIKILGQKVTIGRSKTSQIRLRHQSVSRYHAVIVWQQGRFFIRDNGSSVGTYLNGSRLEANKKEKLRNKDKIKIGVVDQFEFRER